MLAHNPNNEIILCRVCGELRPRATKKGGRICRECLKEKNRESASRWRKENPERVRETRRKFRKANPEIIRERKRKYYADNRVREREKRGKWRDENREHCRRQKREYKRNRRATDAAFAVKLNVRNAICEAVKRGGGAKAHRTEHYLGYPVARLVEWARRNGYNPPLTHIDHIVPVSWFLRKYDTTTALRKAWHLGNLQIIPAKENLRKGARREWLI